MLSQIASCSEQAVPNDTRALSGSRAASGTPARTNSTQILSLRAELGAYLPVVDPTTLASAMNDVIRTMKSLQRSLEFSVDETSGRIIIRIIDKATKEVVRQIPPRDVLEMAGRLRKS